MPFMVVLGPPAEGVSRSLDRRCDLVVGRDGACDLVLPKRSVSRRHARFYFDGTAFLVEDLNSSNGTFVNGRRVESATPLREGDRVSLHDVPIAFHLHGERADNASPPSDARPLGGKTDPMMAVETEPELTILRGRLHSMVEISRRLGGSLSADEIFPRVLDLLFEMYPQAAAGEIQVADNSGRLRPVAMKHGRSADSSILTHLPRGDDLSAEALRTGQSVLRTTEGHGAESVLDEGGSSVVCVPMLGAGQSCRGTILLETDGPLHAFSPEDLELVETVGALAAQALEYARVHQGLLELAETRKRMDIARQIQLRMLPRARPVAPGYAFAEHYEPADAVGGDYFFWDRLPDGRIVLGIADACGKSLAAALTVAQFASEVRHCLATAPTVKRAMTRLNRFVCELDEGFITFCLGLLDPSQHRLAVVSAGHLAPIRKPARPHVAEEFSMDRGSLPLGLNPHDEFHLASLTIAPGDAIILYTDGVIESTAGPHELYGRRRLLKAVSEAPSSDPVAIVSAVVTDLRRFTLGAPPRDDVAIIAFARTED